MAENKYSPGDHLSVERKLYTHHGIYFGDNTVIHYNGPVKGTLIQGIVEKSTLEEFSNGAEIKVIPHPKAKFSRKEILERAESRLKENDYSIFSNNCESFCNWCINGKSKSDQTNKIATFGSAILAGLAAIPGIILFIKRKK
jgi:hypothetical protein